MADRMIESTLEDPKARFALIEDTCRKRTYEKEKYRAVVYRVTGTTDEAAVEVYLTSNILGVDRKACLNEGLREIQLLNQNFARHIVEQAEKKAGADWEDPDLGPVKWLACKEHGNDAYFDGLVMFLQQMTQYLTRGQCLFHSGTGRHLCFKLAPGLPHRAVAALSEFKAPDPVEEEAFRFVQKLTLTERDEPPFELFEELNAYTVTALAMTAVLKNHGVAGIYDKNGKRNGAFVPLFMVYTLRYLEKIRDLDHGMYDENFAPGGTNKDNLCVLLDSAEAAYRGWVLELSRVKKPEKYLEHLLWEHYLEMKSKARGCLFKEKP